jgi:hypothetical protein
MVLTESTGKASLQDFFSYYGRPVKNLSDFWGWKADQITEDLKDMLDELRDFISGVRQNKNGSQTDMAGRLSDRLKSFASKNGINPATASLEDLAKLETILLDKIIELLKMHADRIVDQSLSNKPDNTTSVGFSKKDISLSGPDFQKKILQELFNPSKSYSESIKDSFKRLALYRDSAIDSMNSKIKSYA